MRILLVNGQTRPRSALRTLLEQEPGLTIAGEADPEELPALASQISPALILIDCTFSEELLGYLLLSLKAVLPTAILVVLSNRSDYRHTALRCGADAFISKFDPPDVLLEVLHSFRLHPPKQTYPEGYLANLPPLQARDDQSMPERALPRLGFDWG
jgi:DNA-binding NarL/FixJ family response regulator